MSPGPSHRQRGARISVALDNSYLVAGIFSGVVAWRTRNLLLTIVLGMAAMLIYRALIGATGG